MSENMNRSNLEEFVYKTFTEFKVDRQESENKWQNNIDAYNRALETRWKKGEAGDDKKNSWRSKRFIGITKQKCEAAHSIIVDTIMQGGKVPYFLSLSDLSNQELEQIPLEEKKIIDQKIDLMTAEINDQLSSCGATDQLSKNILSCAIYGETYGKDRMKKQVKKSYDMVEYEDGTQAFEKISTKYEYPAYERVSNWDIFRDVEEDDLQKGRAVIHRQMVSAYELRKMAEFSHSIPAKIEQVINEFKANNNSEESSDSLRPSERDIKNRKKQITLLEYWGRVPRRLADQFEAETKRSNPKKDFDFSLTSSLDIEDSEDSGDDIEVMIFMANNTIVRYVRVDENERPFYRAVWEEPVDGIAGIGIADNLIEIQELINGSVRAFEDNKKLSGNLTLAVKRRMLLNSIDEIEPGKMLEMHEECEDVRQAVQPLQLPDVGDSLIAAINLAQQFADEESSVPRVQQGGASSGRETAFELSQRLEKSGKYLGKVIRNFDNNIIKPVIEKFVDYNMERSGNDEIKENYDVRANGFTSFQSRVTKLAGIVQAIELIYRDEELSSKVKKEEIYKEYVELLDIDTDRWFQSGEDEENRIAQEQALAEANQRAAEIELAKSQAEVQKIEAEIRLENAKAESMVAETKMNAEKLKMEMQEFVKNE